MRCRSQGTRPCADLPANERFATRIVEQAGPFSKTSTVPHYCKGLCDPEKTTRPLANLSKSALRHRVHVLSNRARGMDTFVFVGDLGLRGGGGGESSSAGDAFARQTAVEVTAPGSKTRRALRRTQSTYLQKILNETACQSLEGVVKSFNRAEDADHRVGFKEVFQNIRDAFNEKPVRSVVDKNWGGGPGIPRPMWTR